MADRPIPLIAILGCTAVGKTRLAAHLAAALPGEVVSADSRQVYRHMDIGTGKDLADYEVDGKRVRTHLIDIVDPGYEYNVYEFKRGCVAALEDIAARGLTPVLCGGTGLYLSAILQDFRLPAVPPDPGRRERLASMSTGALVAALSAHGELHNTSDTGDRERLIRAVEIAEAGTDAPAPSVAIDARVFGVHRERDELRRRITERLHERLEQGLIEEVRSLLERGLRPQQLSFYGLEYRHVVALLRGEVTREQMVRSLNTAIHRFAKRQATWFRRMERQGVEIRWLDGGAPLAESLARMTGGS